MLTPQEAVDAVTTGKDLRTINHDGEWLEVFGPGLRILMNKTAHGVAYGWPPVLTYDAAKLNGWLEQCELSPLECSRIMNEVNRRLIA